MATGRSALRLKKKHLDALAYRKSAIQFTKIVAWLHVAEGLLYLVQCYQAICHYFCF